MLLRKAFIAITIFVILFVSGWVMHEEIENVHYANNREGNLNIQYAGEDTDKNRKWTEPFKSREYIRILPRNSE
jgi:hypothetical protein